MLAENRQWWKGSFPAWIVAGLVAIVAWFSKQTFEAMRNDISEIRRTVENHIPKIAILETESAATRRDIQEINQRLK